MPEIELCRICGKRILTSRYSWSEAEIICPICALKLQSATQNKQQETFEGPQKAKTKINRKLNNRYNSTIRSFFNQDEILITWPALIKVLIGGLLGLFIILTAINLTNKQFKTNPANQLHMKL